MNAALNAFYTPTDPDDRALMSTYPVCSYTTWDEYCQWQDEMMELWAWRNGEQDHA